MLVAQNANPVAVSQGFCFPFPKVQKNLQNKKQTTTKKHQGNNKREANIFCAEQDFRSQAAAAPL